jgi:uncharacterized protein
MKIGVISDTHNFFDARISTILAGVDHILHGGDVGRPQIILRLEEIAPVTAVSGNTDDPGYGYRPTEIVELAGLKFLLHHIVNPHALSDSLRGVLERQKPDVVVFGHTHKPFSETLNGTLFFNPGYAGQSRFGMPRSLAILHCGKSGLRQEYLAL